MPEKTVLKVSHMFVRKKSKRLIVLKSWNPSGFYLVERSTLHFMGREVFKLCGQGQVLTLLNFLWGERLAIKNALFKGHPKHYGSTTKVWGF